MIKICAEYVWIDGVGELRSKIKIIEINDDLSMEQILSILPSWNFDGSSTSQALGSKSDIIMRPVNIFVNPFITWIKSYLVLTDCWNPDGTQHISNHRNKLAINNLTKKWQENEPWIGIEQEYMIFERNNVGYKWMNKTDPGSGGQNPYYCSVGGAVALGREISTLHLKLCLEAGLAICGTNAEVMASQWEYQIGPLDPLIVSDQLWISRYILHRVSEKFNCKISLKPKPVTYGDWNGSGAHTNFSTKLMREPNGIQYIYDACNKLELKHQAHIAVYGNENNVRLTCKNETSSINKFDYAVADRSKSVRIPQNVASDKCGYLEDRRPGANMDPYLVCEILTKTILD